ncbi:hypothetical protein CEUSTIGMA_g13544.t1 [Chlamydomonas eustigma]|uniref:DOT1 domain-containing protein n=1 Tax=Chlamydomonas eustigma TaxID=1157962 RepID=A0A250XSR4_9CHLO|nr:hypothetical protein CEUSTIGMA_g13544.t1 [Chlamydomonas eustigma]|eukprot:GAX86131.1 hypothetical protein CEUSTIGMA_g13544.t1 [Chlamydomonas eustigma]
MFVRFGVKGHGPYATLGRTDPEGQIKELRTGCDGRQRLFVVRDEVALDVIKKPIRFPTSLTDLDKADLFQDPRAVFYGLYPDGEVNANATDLMWIGLDLSDPDNMKPTILVPFLCEKPLETCMRPHKKKGPAILSRNVGFRGIQFYEECSGEVALKRILTLEDVEERNQYYMLFIKELHLMRSGRRNSGHFEEQGKNCGRVINDIVAVVADPQQALSPPNDHEDYEDNKQAGGQQVVEDAEKQGGAVKKSFTKNLAKDAKELGNNNSVLKEHEVQMLADEPPPGPGIAYLSPHNNTQGKTLFKDLWAYFAKLGGLGDCSSGMSGTCSKASAVLVLETVQKEMGRDDYEFIDIGAGSGVMVALSLCYGASSAVGIELKNEGQESVYLKSREVFVRNGIVDPRMLVSYGVDVSSTSTLSSNLYCVQGCERKRAVYSFCDGFAEVDRSHMFSLIGRDRQVKLFICSLGKGRGDKFSTPQAVERSINNAAASTQNEPFIACAKLVVRMFGSGAQKTVHVFRRL